MFPGALWSKDRLRLVARAESHTGGFNRCQIILVPQEMERPPPHPAFPHRPFVATAQHVREWGDDDMTQWVGEKGDKLALTSEHTRCYPGAGPDPS